MAALLNPLNQLQNVELLGKWLNSGMSQTVYEGPVVLLAVLTLTLFAGSVAGLAIEEQLEAKPNTVLKRVWFLMNNHSGNMVGRDGFEPSTNWLKANCSTAELTPHD
jgi:hypothetical protein